MWRPSFDAWSKIKAMGFLVGIDAECRDDLWRILEITIFPMKKTHNYGKIHHFSWENYNYKYGDFPTSYVKLPEGNLIIQLTTIGNFMSWLDVLRASMNQLIDKWLDLLKTNNKLYPLLLLRPRIWLEYLLVINIAPLCSIYSYT